MSKIILLACTLLILTGCEVRKERIAAIKNQSIERGHSLYLGNGCAVCHGKSGKGDGPSAGNIFPSPTNFHDLKVFRIGFSVNDIEKTIKKGTLLQGGAMPAFDHLIEQELRDIAVFLKSLQHINNSEITKETIP